jgi:hypothetical protein
MRVHRPWPTTIARLLALVGCLLACSRDGKHNESHGVRSAAATPTDTTAPAELSGTKWSLVEIQPVSDEQRATRPDDPAKYTLTFDSESSDADGLLSLRLDCQRAFGPYQAKRSGARGEGSLVIGPLKITGAPCGPPTLSDRVARDLGFVRSYRFVGGRLAISLMADGGIYVWQRDTSPR